MRKLAVVLLAALAVLLAGCAHRSQQSVDVKLVSSTKGLESCTLLGDVRGAEHLVGGVLMGVARRNARVRMLNQAARMGADTVYLRTHHFWWFGASAIGKAYKCH